MSKFTTKQGAIFITVLIHGAFLLWFSFIKIDFDSDSNWNKIRMSFEEEALPVDDKPQEKWISDDYQEHGLDQKKASLAQTNEAVNEATDQLSKGEQGRLEIEIDVKVKEMAKEASTSGFMEGAKQGIITRDVGVSKAKIKKNDKKAGSLKSEKEDGNIHDKATNITYYLKARTLEVLGLKNPLYLCDEGGVVVVNIVVNKVGEVISASVNDSKSTTKNFCLRSESEQAALKSTFNESNESASKQRGIITYTFSEQ